MIRCPFQQVLTDKASPETWLVGFGRGNVIEQCYIVAEQDVLLENHTSSSTVQVQGSLSVQCEAA